MKKLFLIFTLFFSSISLFAQTPSFNLRNNTPNCMISYDIYVERNCDPILHITISLLPGGSQLYTAPSGYSVFYVEVYNTTCPLNTLIIQPGGTCTCENQYGSEGKVGNSGCCRQSVAEWNYCDDLVVY